MGVEELRPNFRIANERLNIPIRSNEDLKTTIIALRALNRGSEPPKGSSRIAGAVKGLLGLTSHKERIGQAVERVWDLLEKPHVYVPQEDAARFKEFVQARIINRLFELERRAAAEDHAVIQLFNAVQLEGKPSFDDLSREEKATACRRWLQKHTNRLNNVNAIDLAGRNLTVVPREIALFRNLRRLDMTRNQIQNLQEVALPASLRTLYLGGNQIQNLQGMAPLSLLSSLFLSNNQISELPNWVFQLPETCFVFATHNRFTPQYIEQFNQRLAANPNPPNITFTALEFSLAPTSKQNLDEQLNAWNNEHIERFQSPCVENFDQLFAMEEPGKSQLAEYLDRLRGTKDYEEGEASRANIVRRVGNMLRLASANPRFRDQMVEAIADGLEGCGDRVLVMFNDLEILWQGYQENMTEERIRALAIGQGRYELIKKLGLEEARKRNLGDEIETILYLHLSLRDHLNLPISTQGMLYPGISGVDQEMLNKISARVESSSDEALLANSSIWQKWQQEHQQSETDRITDHYMELLDQARELYDSDDRQKYLATHKDLAEVLQPMDQSHNTYDGACRLISQARNDAIAMIGGNPPIAST